MPKHISKKILDIQEADNPEKDLVKLSYAKKKYKGEWLAFLIVKELKNGDLKGKLIAHNKNDHKLHEDVRKKDVDGVYITFAGKQKLPILL